MAKASGKAAAVIASVESRKASARKIALAGCAASATERISPPSNRSLAPSSISRKSAAICWTSATLLIPRR